MKEENIFTYNNSFWLKIFIYLLIVLTASYIAYALSVSNTNGATFVGLMYGVVALIAVILLMYYGIRKRTYKNTLGTLKGWLSFHVYIGLLVLLIVPMHAGFKFGVNVHTLAFVLMAIVIVSGMFGAYFYINYPVEFTKYGNELLYAQFDDEINKLVKQMRGISRNKSQIFAQECEQAVSLGIPESQRGWRLIFGNAAKYIPSETEYLNQIQRDMNQVPEIERKDYQRLAVVSLQKMELQKRFVSQMRIKNILEAWLYVHLPVSFIMLVALTVHIVSVIYYNGFSMFLP